MHKVSNRMWTLGTKLCHGLKDEIRTSCNKWLKGPYLTLAERNTHHLTNKPEAELNPHSISSLVLLLQVFYATQSYCTVLYCTVLENERYIFKKSKQGFEVAPGN